MKWFFGVIAALLIVLVLAIINIPASVLPIILEQAAAKNLLPPDAPKLSMGETSGTLWNGQANEAVVSINGQPLLLGKLSWQLHAGALMDRHLVIDLQSQAPGQNLKATVLAVEQGEVTVSDAEGRLPISVLEPWMPLLVKGEIAFALDHLVFNQQELLAVDAVVNLEYVDWLAGDYDMPLGSYMAQVTLERQDVQVKIDDFSASLGVDGLLTVKPSGAYRLKASLIPRQGLAPEVAQSIIWLGKRQADGSVLVNQSGRF